MSGTVLVEVSIGELIDKITILRIKLARFVDPEKLRNVTHELELLVHAGADAVVTTPELVALEEALRGVNDRIWDLEDVIRDLMHAGDLGSRFVEATSTVHKANEERAALKRRINEVAGSSIVEEKSYGNVA